MQKLMVKHFNLLLYKTWLLFHFIPIPTVLFSVGVAHHVRSSIFVRNNFYKWETDESVKNVIFLVSSEKSKHRWNNIHTMAEGKASLQVLLSMVKLNSSLFVVLWATRNVFITLSNLKAVNGKSKQIKMEKDVEGDRKELDELRTNTEVN